MESHKHGRANTKVINTAHSCYQEITAPVLLPDRSPSVYPAPGKGRVVDVGFSWRVSVECRLLPASPTSEVHGSVSKRISNTDWGTCKK